MRAHAWIPSALAAVLLWAGAARSDDGLAVVVHPSRAVEVSMDELARIFLKRRTFWADGSPILPINRESTSDERRRFTRAVFAERAARLQVYWNRQYFKGVLPPATLASDEAVKRYVAREPRAIGYIRTERVDDTVRVVLYVDRAPEAARPAGAPPGEHRSSHPRDGR